MTRHSAPFSALCLAACVLFGAGAGVADPDRDGRRDHRGDASGGYPRPEEGRGDARRAYGVPPRGPNSLGSDRREQQEEARFGVNQGRLAPLDRVIDSIGRRTPGRQLDSGIEYTGGRAVYRVRWMTNDGRRVDYLVDAATGTIMSGH